MREPPILHRKITQEWELDSSIIDIIRWVEAEVLQASRLLRKRTAEMVLGKR